MHARLKELIDNFALFDDWEARYAYLIDLGKKIPPMESALKTDAALVPGCTSRVWMIKNAKNGRFHFIADSDAHIVRGLIAVLYAAYDDLPVEEVAGIDIHSAFESMGLECHLSPSRRNGFFAMVERIKAA